MDIYRPLFWHQGLFLQPQHFQLLDQANQSRLIPFNSLTVPHFWGITQLDIKKNALNLKSFGVLSGTFLFPDGTYVELPGNAVIEDRSFDRDWTQADKPLPVYLGLRKFNPTGENVTVLKKGESLKDITTRFVARPEAEETKDLHAGGSQGQVKKMDYLLKIFWGSEKENLGDYVLIPIAQVERSGADFRLSPQFVPPCVSVSGSPVLVKLVKEIHDQLISRSRELEEHKSQRGIHRAEFGSRDMVYLLALRSINRFLPWLRHNMEAPQVHPWTIYGILRQIIGDLSCFSEKINVFGENEEGKESPLPLYEHQNLFEGFSTAQRLIERTLVEITAGPDHILQLKPSNGYFSADLKPQMLEANSRFYLAVAGGDDPKTTVSAVSRLAKLSSHDHLGKLVSHALPGIPLEHLPQPPQELPRRRNVLYFSIDSHAKHWTNVKKDKNLSLSWDGAPKDLQLELMVISG